MSILDTHLKNRLKVSFFNFLLPVVFAVVTSCASTAGNKITRSIMNKHEIKTQPIVRVAVEGSSTILKFEGSNLKLVLNGEEIKLPDIVLIQMEKDGIKYGEMLIEYPVELLGDKVVYINGNPYYGKILFKEGAVIDEVPLEEYIKGVLSREVSPSWPIEALKAQAVVSRTFALYRIINSNNTNYHLDNTVLSQRFEYRVLNDNISRAVEQTEGEVLTYRGKIIEALYHSNSGGRTESCYNIFHNDLPYLRSIHDPYSLRTPYTNWKYEISSLELARKLEKSGYLKSLDRIINIKIKSRTSSGRVSEFLIQLEDGKRIIIDGDKLRMVIGTREFKSLLITEIRIKRNSNGDYLIGFKGRGYGHGVGMSQWGAKVMAESGVSYNRILSFYYRGTAIVDYRSLGIP